MSNGSSAEKYALPDIDHEDVVLVLQGGGALGAYQAGVFEELTQFPREPTWIAGVSIGAINAALIAGNPPAKRVERLREFWYLVSSRASSIFPAWGVQNEVAHQVHALMAASIGVPGFYEPRFPAPMFQANSSDAAISYYDTAPLRKTLEQLVDFDLINSRKLRLSVGAVNVLTGNSTYFDNALQIIGPEHIMASCALPPAYAPVLIDGEPYWDGGVVTNTPLQYVLDQHTANKILIAQVDLFSARGAMPINMSGVMSRQKDIMYSSRTRYNTDQAAEAQRNRCTILELISKLPAKQRNEPNVKALEAANQVAHVDIVHLIYRQNRFELDSKDYEFSRNAVLQHWADGQRDMKHTINHADLLTRSDMGNGINVYDLAHDYTV